MIEKGILYIAFEGDSKACRFKEMEYSISSLKKFMPNIPIALFTNKKDYTKNIDILKIIDIKTTRIKHTYLYESPFERTLYLDCDTKIVGNIDSIFDLMNRFDIAATHDLIRKDERKSKKYPDYAIIPDSFPEYGGGVILFRKNKVVEEFFKLWQKNFKEWFDLTKEERDQPSFRVSLWQSNDLHLYTLPPEFNIRFKNYNNIVPRIYHKHDMWKKG